MEQLIRIVSWTVILGAAVALWFGGIRPLLPEGLLPDVDPSRVSGTAVREGEAEACRDASEKPGDPAERAGTDAGSCHEKLVTQH
ncbi:MAG: hypothetical protein P8008_04700 [Gammaproteobacteria bacterium]